MPHPDDPSHGDEHSSKSHKPEGRRFHAHGPADPDDPESVRAWLQDIANQVVARDEEVEVSIVHGGSGDDLTGVDYGFYVGPCPIRFSRPDDEPYPDGGEEDRSGRGGSPA